MCKEVIILLFLLKMLILFSKMLFQHYNQSHVIRRDGRLGSQIFKKGEIAILSTKSEHFGTTVGSKIGKFRKILRPSSSPALKQLTNQK